MRWIGPFAIALILAAGCVSPGSVSIHDPDPGQDCPAPHFHATFAVFIPGPRGAPERVDFASPKAPDRRPYYDIATRETGGAANMSKAVHMHQTGTETGGPALAPAQLHMEEDGTCVSVSQALHTVEVQLGKDTLRLWGAHAQVGQVGTWTATGPQELRFWVQSDVGGLWTWQERTWEDVAGYQLQEGEALLVAIGDYSESQVGSMQGQVPAPITRPKG